MLGSRRETIQHCQEPGEEIDENPGELDAALVVFNWLPEGRWRRNVEVEGSLDDVATGLPEAGDEMPDAPLDP